MSTLNIFFKKKDALIHLKQCKGRKLAFKYVIRDLFTGTLLELTLHRFCLNETIETHGR